MRSIKTLSLFLLLLYQKVAGYWVGPVCRFYPTCSHYTSEAIEKLGVVNGIFLALKRLIRCNHFFAGGYDPVP